MQMNPLPEHQINWEMSHPFCALNLWLRFPGFAIASRLTPARCCVKCLYMFSFYCFCVCSHASISFSVLNTIQFAFATLHIEPSSGHGAHAHPHSDRGADAIPRFKDRAVSPSALCGSQRQEGACCSAQTLHVHVLQGFQGFCKIIDGWRRPGCRRISHLMSSESFTRRQT